MKIKIISAGKTESGFIHEGVQHYLARLANYCSISYEEFSLGATQKSSPQRQIKAEAEQFKKKLNHGDRIIVLDETGKQFTSVGFSKVIENYQVHSAKNLVFVIGGPFGIDHEIVQMAELKLSLSKFTFTHQMVRVILLEQLYRSYSILANEKYHHK